MSKADFENKTFDELIEELYEEVDTITTYETLKDYAINSIDNDNLYLAIHILNAISEDEADYYDYDYNMGMCETPTPLTCEEDLIDYIED